MVAYREETLVTKDAVVGFCCGDSNSASGRSMLDWLDASPSDVGQRSGGGVKTRLGRRQESCFWFAGDGEDSQFRYWEEERMQGKADKETGI